MPLWALQTNGAIVDRIFLDARRISAWWGVPEGKHPVLVGIHFASAAGDAGLVVQIAFNKRFRIRPGDNFVVPDVHEHESTIMPGSTEVGNTRNRDIIFHFLNAGDSVYPVFSPIPIKRSVVINLFNNASPVITFFFEFLDGSMVFDRLNLLQDIKVVNRQVSPGEPFFWVGNEPGDRHFTVPVEGGP